MNSLAFTASPEVASALAAGKPVVALESTIISHGLPRPSNLQVAREVEDIVRAHGATPATIAILDGKVLIGLTDDQLVEIANRDDIAKASSRDLAIIAATGKSAATTVAATAHLAVLASLEKVCQAMARVSAVKLGFKKCYVVPVVSAYNFNVHK